jgi:endonuclease/exonuclease/phosphatase family metal-dependent hydrolase
VRCRVVAYNVRGFRDDVEALGRIVRDLQPDVLLLNETGARWRLRRFARVHGFEAATDPWAPLRRRAKDAVLVRPPWRIAAQRQQRFAGSAFLYPRAALIASLEWEPRHLLAVAIHLGLRPAERRRHVDELLETLEDGRDPVVIGGDTNERPEGRAMTRLAKSFPDAWTRGGEGRGDTFSATAPVARIDYVFTSPGIGVIRAWVPDGADPAVASDHRPVVADLDIPDG